MRSSEHCPRDREHCAWINGASTFLKTVSFVLVGSFLSAGTVSTAWAQAEKKPAAGETQGESGKAAEKPAAGAAQGEPAAGAPKAEASKEAAPKEPPPEPTPAMKKEAKEAFGAAQKAYEEKKFEEAYENFSKAHSVIPSVHALYWMAMSLDQQSKVTEAYAAFELFFANPDHEKLGEEKVAFAKQRLEELGKTPAELTVTLTPATAILSVDGAAEPGASPVTLKLAAGKHTLTVSAPGYVTQEVEIFVKPGESGERSVELAEAPPPAAAPPPPEPVAPPPLPPPPPPAVEPRSKLPAYVTLGIAGASAVVGTIFGIQALGAKSDFDDNPTAENADDVERNALIADMAFGVTVTLGITGFVLLTSSDGEEQMAKKVREQQNARFRLTPYVSPKGGGAAARLTF